MSEREPDFYAMLRHVPHEILPGLWISSDQFAADPDLLAEHKFDAVLNLTEEREVSNDEVIKRRKWVKTYMELPLSDDLDVDQKSTKLVDSLPAVCMMVSMCLDFKQKVLVHCVAGESRSPAVALGYVMSAKKMSLADAWTHCKKKRHCIDPNPRFLRQLLDWEKNLGMTRSLPEGNILQWPEVEGVPKSAVYFS